MLPPSSLSFLLSFISFPLSPFVPSSLPNQGPVMSPKLILSNPPAVDSQRARMTATCHHAQLSVSEFLSVG